MVRAVLVAVGVVHVVPGFALVFPDRLADLYGMGHMDISEVVLLRHRALLLALLGAGLLAAVPRHALRRPALVGALVSNVVFVGLVATAGSSPEIVRVAVVDAGLLPLVVVALLLDGRGRDRPGPALAGGPR